MWQCKIIDFLFFIFPVKFWQDFLIRSHVSKCEFCQNRLADEKEARSLLIQENDIENRKDFWPGVKAVLQVRGASIAQPSILLRKWMFRTAAFLVIVVAGLWILNNLGTNRPPADENIGERFRINYIKVDNKPAQTFLYQPKDSGMIIIWAQKANPDKGV